MSLEVDDVSVTLGETSILEDVSLTVDPGEFVALVGPNGSGKTTLVRTISAAITPASGTVTIEGRDVGAASSRESSRLTAVVPQETNLSFAFPVRDIVEMGRYPHRSRFSPPKARDRRLVDRALERTETTGFADRSIDSLSGGERQRVLIARAIAQDTPVMLFDEPTASLDINHQVETLELIRGLTDDDVAVLAAIHDLDLAARFCDRLVLIDQGQIRQRGPPETVLTASTLEDTFGVTTGVSSDPFHGTPTVTPLADTLSAPLPDRVHVLGGGTVASRIVGSITAAGVVVSVGPVAPTDRVVPIAERAGCEVLASPPFEPIPDTARSRLAELLTGATVPIVADLELSRGSQAVLEPLLDHTAVVIEERPLAERTEPGLESVSRYESVRTQGIPATLADWPAALREAHGASRSVAPVEED